MERTYLSETGGHRETSSFVRLRAGNKADIHALEQIKVQRKNMAQVCKMCVKSIVDKSPFEAITDDCPHMNSLCNVMEHIFVHRMQARWSLFSTTETIHFWHVIQQYASPVTVSSIDDMESVLTELGKCRAWLRLSLVQKRLATFMNTLVSKQNELKLVYMQGSFLISSELQEVAGVLRCLDAIDFNLCLRDQNFDFGEKFEIDYSPYLVFHQSINSRRDDMQEEQRLSSVSSQNDSLFEGEQDNSIKELLKTEREQKNYYEELVSVRDSQISRLQKEFDDQVKESEKEKKELNDIVLELQEQISKLQENLRRQRPRSNTSTSTSSTNRRSGIFSSLFGTDT